MQEPNIKESLFDQYTLKARIQPALLAMLPIGILLFMWMPGGSLPAGILLGIIGTGGGMALLAQISRDPGMKKQPALWESWGGPPTTRLLRFRESPNRIILNRWRATLEKLMGHALPSEEEEAEDSDGADQKYDAAVSLVLEVTRDSSKFPLVFAENANYGFRRNLWGLKPYCLVIALLSAIGSWGFFLSSVGFPPTESWLDNVFKNPDGLVMTRLVGSIFNTIGIAVWLIVITPQWVRTAAEAYAQRLLGAVDALDTNVH